MKSLITALVTVLALGVSASVQAVDHAEVEAAFKTFVEYQKNDDERVIDLFSPDVAVTFNVLKGKTSQKVTLPPELFFQTIKEQLGKKAGSADTYDEIKVSGEGDHFRIDCMLHDGKTGLTSPYVQEYVKTADGLKISKVFVTISDESGGQ